MCVHKRWLRYYLFEQENIPVKRSWEGENCEEDWREETQIDKNKWWCFCTPLLSIKKYNAKRFILQKKKKRVVLINSLMVVWNTRFKVRWDFSFRVFCRLNSWRSSGYFLLLLWSGIPSSSEQSVSQVQAAEVGWIFSSLILQLQVRSLE